eukprot:scaffold8194_cov199-Ochromonas_danica.AAC.1
MTQREERDREPRRGNMRGGGQEEEVVKECHVRMSQSMCFARMINEEDEEQQSSHCSDTTTTTTTTTTKG